MTSLAGKQSCFPGFQDLQTRYSAALPFLLSFENDPEFWKYAPPAGISPTTNCAVMKSIVPTALRAIVVFAVFAGLQYLIPYYLLALGGLVAGVFLYKTSDDRPLALGVLIGSLAFAAFAFAMAQIYPVQ